MQKRLNAIKLSKNKEKIKREKQENK